MNVTATELVTAFMEALEAKQLDKAGTYLSDNFQFSGSTPLPLDKDKLPGHGKYQVCMSAIRQ